MTIDGNVERFTSKVQDLEQVEQRDRLAAIALNLGKSWDSGFEFSSALDHIFVSEEALAALPGPGPALTPDNVTAIISDTITEIRNLIAQRSPEPPADAPRKTTDRTGEVDCFQRTPLIITRSEPARHCPRSARIAWVAPEASPRP